MKKILVICFALLTVITMQAQSTVWWGYVGDDTDELTGLGVGNTDTYHCAIFVPGDHSVAGGKTIKGIRFAMFSSNVSNMKIWLSNSKPTTLNENTTVRLQNVDKSAIGKDGIVEVALDESYQIPTSGIYVGYSFTITKVSTNADGYPIATVPETDAPNTLLVRTNNAVTQWQDMNGQGFGRLYLRLQLEGEFADNMVSASDFGTYYVKKGGEVKANVEIVNNGNTPVSNIDYTITTGQTTTEELHIILDKSIEFANSSMIEVPLQSDSEQSRQEKILTITKVNGNANNDTQKTATGVLYTLNTIIDRNIAVEEYTGTGCGWCPRGLVGMDNMRRTFGDRFVGIGIHQYNSGDPMYLANNSYARLSFSGAPSCMIDRGEDIDPYYGSDNSVIDDCNNRLAVPALVDLSVNGVWNSDSTKVKATATATALFGGSNYKVEFVLIADSLQGTGSAWNQANYYYQYSSSQLPNDLAQFASDGKNGKSSISGWIFNDVAISSSYVSGVNKATSLNNMEEGQPVSCEYTLSLPTKANLVNALKKNCIYVAVLLIDEEDRVANCAKALVKGNNTDGIEAAPTVQSKIAAARYSVDGRQLSAPKRGLNIVRMSDGTTRKEWRR